ncbi:hypothetical protein QQZ08_004649 [Neonectria magnoliae]|uniref:Uncharacterized protein n=1 Tax=Neonectria magnoliae TaxID=2732573 RepID=A0ABR1I6M8_9HYPO
MKNSRQEYNSRGKHADFIDAIKEGNDVDFEIRNNDGLTVLHMAVMSSGIQVSKLMAAGADLSTLTKDSQNILGHLGNVNVNQADNFGRTPLHYACASGEAESVALLLKHGGNVNAVDSHGCTLLHACAEATAEQKIWDLQDEPFEWMRGPRQDPLRPSGSIKYPRFAHSDVNGSYKGKPAPGGTVLHILASADHYWQLKAMKYLIAHGADVDALDGEHQSPIHIAARGKQHRSERIEGFWRSEALRILLDLSINDTDNAGNTPLQFTIFGR